MYKIKLPSNPSKRTLEKFFKSLGLAEMVNNSKEKSLKVNQMIRSKPYRPDLKDLYRIFKLIYLNKRITILEYGSGWSTLVMGIALHHLKKKYHNSITKLRRNNPFELFVVENEKKYLKISKKRINSFKTKNSLDIKITFLYSKVKMTEFNGRIATEFEKLPSCNPDFVYLDGPDQFKVKGNINGISTRHKDMMPMACDILKFEYFYNPGTILLIDGRGANAKFLVDQFKRPWRYLNMLKYDQHLFQLVDKPIGIHNKNLLKFYKHI